MGKAHVNISIEVENIHFCFGKKLKPVIAIFLHLAIISIVTALTLKLLVLYCQWPGWGNGRSYWYSDPKSQVHFLKVQVLLPYRIDEILNWSCDIFIMFPYTVYLPPCWLSSLQVTTNVVHIFLISPAFKNYNSMECMNSSISHHTTWLCGISDFY